MKYFIFAIASIFGLTAVILGAFGAHALKEVLTPDQLSSYHTGVEYQFYHTFALFIVFRQYERSRKKVLQWAGLCFIIGIIFFSGSIYLLSTREILGIGSASWLGPITPIGGMLFITGWLLLFIYGTQKNLKKGRVNGK